MKTMNVAHRLAWALIVMMPLWFGSCKKDGTDIVTPSSSTVVGSWKISGYTIDPGVDFMGNGTKTTDLLAFFKTVPGGADIVACLTDTKITFNNGGKVTATPSASCKASTDMNPVEDNSTWKLDGNKMTITSGGDVTVYDASTTGNTLKLSGKEMEDYDGDGKEESYTVTMTLTKA